MLRTIGPLEQIRRNVAFYRDFWRAAGVDVRDLRLPDHLPQLPVVTKADLLRGDVASRLNAEFARRELTTQTTSGSTGQPLVLLIDRATARRRRARFLRALLSCGYRPGDRLMLISSRPSESIRRPSRWATLARWTYVDLYAGETELVSEYLRVKPQVLYGPLSALLLLAEAVRRHGTPGCRPAVVVSTAEQLTDSSRRTIRTAFGVNVTDFYGMTELGLVAWRSPGTDEYAIAQHDFHVEFLPTDLPGFERLIVTDLSGGAMPLIRYDTGDVVRRDTTLAGSPVVEIGGRQVDFIWLPSGRRVSPYRVDGALSELPGVERYEVVQQADLSIDVFIGTRRPDVALLLKTARDALLVALGECVDLKVERLPSVPRPPAHKVRPIQSRARMSA
jgi:phenylacetate-coenzyme A ligase PaaK-like adenylate-forming protein